MHASMFTITALAATVYGAALPTPTLTLPSPISVGKILGTFVPPGPQIFNNASCKLEETLFPGQPLGQLFGVSNFLGKIIGPVLVGAIGQKSVDDIDSVADQLCISAEQEPNDGDGACQFALAAINDFVTAKDPQLASDKYRCLLDLLCISPISESHTGTCQELLAGLDCNANRIVSPSDPECTTGSK